MNPGGTLRTSVYSNGKNLGMVNELSRSGPIRLGPDQDQHDRKHNPIRNPQHDSATTRAPELVREQSHPV